MVASGLSQHGLVLEYLKHHAYADTARQLSENPPASHSNGLSINGSQARPISANGMDIDPDLTDGGPSGAGPGDAKVPGRPVFTQAEVVSIERRRSKYTHNL